MACIDSWTHLLQFCPYKGLFRFWEISLFFFGLKRLTSTFPIFLPPNPQKWGAWKTRDFLLPALTKMVINHLPALAFYLHFFVSVYLCFKFSNFFNFLPIFCGRWFRPPTHSKKKQRCCYKLYEAIAASCCGLISVPPAGRYILPQFIFVFFCRRLCCWKGLCCPSLLHQQTDSTHPFQTLPLFTERCRRWWRAQAQFPVYSLCFWLVVVVDCRRRQESSNWQQQQLQIRPLFWGGGGGCKQSTTYY